MLVSSNNHFNYLLYQAMRNAYLFCMMISIVLATSGCNKSDDDGGENSGPVEIIDESILNGDVNAPDFWDGDNLVWNDEFDGDALSTEKWFEQRYIGGRGNSELQTYAGGDNLEVSNGTLKIHVEKPGPGQNTGDYTSGRVDSKFVFTYGRIEMRAKLPAQAGPGLWVKLWLLGANFDEVGFPQAGVIDMLNYVSHVPDQFFSGAITTANFNKPDIKSISDAVVNESIENDFHNYGVLWTDQYLKFYLDEIDNITFTYRRPENVNQGSWPFDAPFYFVMNVAVGGEFGGVEGVEDSMFPTEMEIDYVRVYHGKKE